MPAAHAVSGHVFRVDRSRGPVWYAKYRLSDGRQVQKRIGPAWTGRGRPPAGYVTMESDVRGRLAQLVLLGAAPYCSSVTCATPLRSTTGRAP